MVPKDWQHPKVKRFNHLRNREEEIYQPMYDEPFAPAMRNWYAGWEAWERGERPEEAVSDTFFGWAGKPPDPDYYRPDWPAESQTHYMMYEDTSEGTPISPAFETPEELARWLADTGASAFGDMTATYEQWLATIKRRWAVSAVVRNGKIDSGVAGM
jgi:hypothetical protein